jgi:hypothetical protein
LKAKELAQGLLCNISNVTGHSKRSPARTLCTKWLQTTLTNLLNHTSTGVSSCSCPLALREQLRALR